MGRRLAAILGVSLATALLPGLPVAAEAASESQNEWGCSQPTRVLTGDSTAPLKLGTDQTVLLESGSFSGALESLPAGSRLCIAPGATLSTPAIGSAAGLIANEGTMIAPGFATEPGFELQNSGSLLVTSDLTLVAGGRIDNGCRISLRGRLDISAELSNAGSITTRELHNSGTVQQDEHAVVHGNDLTNEGSITGGGSYRFSGLTTNTGTVVADNANLPIVLDDATPTGHDEFDVNTGQVSNVTRATVTSTPTDRPSGCTTPDPEPAADVSVSATGPSAITGGDQAPYQVTVSNVGGATAETVVVFADFQPAELTATATDAGVVANGAVSWRLDAMAAGETRRLTVDAVAPATGELTYRVSSWSSTPDPVPENNDGSLPAASGRTRVTGPATDEPTEPTPAVRAPLAAVSSTPSIIPPITTPRNQPPAVADVEVTTVAMTDAGGAIEATDPDPGQSVTYALVMPPDSGRAEVERDGRFGYSPADGFTGRDAFTVRGCDDGSPARCDEATISIVVLPGPRDDTVMTWAGKPIGVNVNDNDLGGASAPDWVVGPQHGSAVTGPTMVYTPAGSYTGWDTMTYQRCAPAAPDVCAQATLKVGVLPLAEDDFFRTAEGRAFLAAAAANDFGDTSDFTIIDEPDFGDVEDDAEGDFLYTPDEDFVGEDSFTYRVCSRNAPDLCDVGVVKMRVDDVVEPTASVDEVDPEDIEDDATVKDTATPSAMAASGLSPAPVVAAGLVTCGLIALAWRWRRAGRTVLSDGSPRSTRQGEEPS